MSATFPISWRLSFALFVIWLIVLPGLSAAQPKFRPNPNDARVGDPAKKVERLWGNPSSICRQILFRRHIEQWNYDDIGIRVEVNCVRGEDPVVSQVTPIRER